MGKLHNKIALVTGAGRGIGREVALKLAAEGARIVVNDIDAAPTKEVVRAVRSIGGKAIACAGNVTTADFPERFVATALDHFGGIDIIVNNADDRWDDGAQRMSDEQWYATIELHLTAPFRILRAAAGFIREAARKEKAQGIDHFRKVVNVSSIPGGHCEQRNHASVKAGIRAMTRTLAREWSRYRVNVNVIAVGLSGSEGAISSSRVGTSAEAAGAVALFCYPESNTISGETVVCGGGFR